MVSSALRCAFAVMKEKKRGEEEEKMRMQA